MDAGRLEHYRAVLNSLRSELLASLGAESEDTKPVSPDRAIGRLTRQDAMLSQQMALELKRRTEARLEQVKRALTRLDRDSFGYCVRCEEEISEARLRVKPETPICIACAGGGKRPVA